MHSNILNFKIIALVDIYSLADLNRSNCVELSVFEGKLGRCLVKVKKSSEELNQFSSELNLLSLSPSKCLKLKKLDFRKVNIRNLPNMPLKRANSSHYLNNDVHLDLSEIIYENRVYQAYIST